MCSLVHRCLPLDVSRSGPQDEGFRESSLLGRRFLREAGRGDEEGKKPLPDISWAGDCCGQLELHFVGAPESQHRAQTRATHQQGCLGTNTPNSYLPRTLGERYSQGCHRLALPVAMFRGSPGARGSLQLGMRCWQLETRVDLGRRGQVEGSPV